MNILEAVGIDHDTFELLGPWSKLEGITRAGDEIIARDIDLDSRHGKVRILYRTGTAKIVSRQDGRILTSDAVRSIAEPRRARLAQIAKAQAEAKIAYDAHDILMSEWYAPARMAVAHIADIKPQRRSVKRGRKITKAEGRAMALDCGFDPAVQGMYHEDPADAALADAEHKVAWDEWQRLHDAALAEFKSAHPQPPKPAMKPWHIYTVGAADQEMPKE
jgi:hypothetical protein